MCVETMMAWETCEECETEEKFRGNEGVDVRNVILWASPVGAALNSGATMTAESAEQQREEMSEERTSEEAETTPLREVRPAFGPGDVHVLLADDEEVTRKVMGRLLETCGYRVTVVSSGREALSLMRTRLSEFQLILSDVAMPGLSGPELLRSIRSSRALHSLPVVMMSAHEHAGTVFECIRRGAEDYLLKPVSRREVRNLWQHVYRRRCGLRAVCELPSEPPPSQPSDVFRPVYDESALYTANEMRVHCQRQIERYQRVIEVIDHHPEFFPASRTQASAAHKEENGAQVPSDKTTTPHAVNGGAKRARDSERERDSTEDEDSGEHSVKARRGEHEEVKHLQKQQ